ncbi:uncharacterized protein Tco025E_00089 [Trypanosoma conorhini]|uniref:Uncharacterized protein n=1 Tax=Trypanosoma conorhini TaxID=83891 RepID=A0A422QCP6_9TRYP|nr:uncharacterized protein Tco025E_00089 [Trypanosoma conorhini]RNF27705.1 hypothetical protein Tco025E_00089 [Trypanosoma conorhini]
MPTANLASSSLSRRIIASPSLAARRLKLSLSRSSASTAALHRSSCWRSSAAVSGGMKRRIHKRCVNANLTSFPVFALFSLVCSSMPPRVFYFPLLFFSPSSPPLLRVCG